MQIIELQCFEATFNIKIMISTFLSHVSSLNKVVVPFHKTLGFCFLFGHSK
jgi:hypothetical protein